MKPDLDAARPQGTPRHYSVPSTGDPHLPQVVGLGWQFADTPDYCWDGTKRGKTPYFVFQYTLSGCGALDADGRRRRVEPGHAFIVQVPDKHVYLLPPGWPEWEFVFMTITGCCAQPLWQRITERVGPVLHLAPASEALTIFKGLYARRASGQHLEALENAEITTRFLLSLLAAQSQDYTLTGAAVSRAAAWARENLAGGANVKGMARAAGLSRHHFARLFKERTGSSPVEYLARLRLRRAAAMLRDGSGDLAEVAQASGFNSPTYMCRVFKKLTGMTPGEIRNRPALAIDLLTRPL